MHQRKKAILWYLIQGGSEKCRTNTTMNTCPTSNELRNNYTAQQFFCDICKVQLNSLTQAEQHKRGKSHRLKEQNKQSQPYAMNPVRTLPWDVPLFICTLSNSGGFFFLLRNRQNLDPWDEIS